MTVAIALLIFMLGLCVGIVIEHKYKEKDEIVHRPDYLDALRDMRFDKEQDI
jgi:hypothetical protein